MRMCQRQATFQTRDIMCMHVCGMWVGPMTYMCRRQVTFQARDIKESRHLYDQVKASLSSVVSSLSPASPSAPQMRGKVLGREGVHSR